MQKPSTVQDVVAKGLQEYEVTEEVMRNSVERFVRESLKYGILEEGK